MKQYVACYHRIWQAIAALALTLGVAQQNAEAGEWYRLGCRGGTSFTYQISAGVFGGIDGDRLALYTSFLPAAGSVGSGLSPGECAWFDRPLSPTEPRRLVVTGEPLRNFFVRFKPTGVGSQIAGEVGSYSSDNPSLRWMGQLKNPDSYVVFCVRSLLPSNQALLVDTWGNATHTCR